MYNHQIVVVAGRAYRFTIRNARKYLQEVANPTIPNSDPDSAINRPVKWGGCLMDSGPVIDLAIGPTDNRKASFRARIGLITMPPIRCCH